MDIKMIKFLNMKKILNLILTDLLLFPSLSFAFTVEKLTYSVSGAGATVTGLGDSSYYGEIIIPKTVEYEGVTLLVLAVAESAFYGFSNLTGVTIPSTVTKIGDKAFMNCENLKTVILEDGEDDLETGYSYVLYGDYWTSFKDSPIETLYLGRQLSYFDAFSPFRDNPALSSVTISDNVKSIGDRLFNGCPGLTEITIPQNVSSIGEYAFYGCTGLTDMTIPDGVISISGAAFCGCSGLQNVTIGSHVTSLGSVAFRDCTALKEVTIGESVTLIGYNAFYGDTALESVISLNPEPPTCSLSGSGVFYKVDTSTCVLYVPLGAKTAYSTAEAWQDFLYIEEEQIDGNTVEDNLVIDFDGIRSSSENIVSNVSFKIDFALLNVSSALSFAGPFRIGLSDKDGYIKEWIIDPITWLYLSAGSSMSCYGFTCLIMSEIEDGDRIRLYCQDSESGEWKLIMGITTTIAWEIVLGDDTGGGMNPIDGNIEEDSMKLYDYGLECQTDNIEPNERFNIVFKVLNASSTNHSGKYRFGLSNEEGFIKDWISPSFDTGKYYDNGIQPNYWFSTSEWCYLNKFEDGDRIRFYYKDDESDEWKLLTPYRNGVVWEIVLGEDTAVSDITANGNAEPTGYYTTDGEQVPALQRGINIIRYSDGSARKVLVK